MISQRERDMERTHRHTDAQTHRHTETWGRHMRTHTCKERFVEREMHTDSEMEGCGGEEGREKERRETYSCICGGLFTSETALAYYFPIL